MKGIRISVLSIPGLVISELVVSVLAVPVLSLSVGIIHDLTVSILRILELSVSELIIIKAWTAHSPAGHCAEHDSGSAYCSERGDSVQIHYISGA